MPRCEFHDPGQVASEVSSGFHGRKILVVGDLMLDIHLWGSVSRISPEAPVPVVRCNRQTLVAGGAGNVAMNLVGLGLKVQLCGLVGKDDPSRQMRASLESAGIETAGLIEDEGRPTTTKMRVIGGHQQMLRVDQESVEPPSALVESAMLDRIHQEIAHCSAVILSDYAKGVLTPAVCQQVIAWAKERGIPVLVDPKGADWQKYTGATRITPNRPELATLTGKASKDREEIAAVARELCSRLQLGSLIVTLSEEGMLQVNDKDAIHVPAMAKEVFDVSGAGDTAIATLAAALAAGIDGWDALLLANLASGVVVAKVGTVPIQPGELLATLEDSRSSLSEKIVSRSAAADLVKKWKQSGEKVVFSNGCFDILHAGHVSYLAKARQTGDRLVVGLNADDSVRRLKGPTRPINDESQRAIVLAGLQSVDAVVLFEEDTPLDLICDMRPDILVKGADYREEDVVGAREVRQWGGDVRLIDLVEGVSTTKIAKKISGGG